MLLLNLFDAPVLPVNKGQDNIRSAHFISNFRPCTLLAILLMVGSLPSIAAAQDSAVAQLNPVSVPARGEQSSLLTLKAFGRYAITVSSSQGVGLQTLDRMSGAGNISGVAGQQDGRLDLFLDRGEYKILTHAAERGNGLAKLSAHAFKELNERPPLLIEQRLERAALADFEQRSYWLEVKEKRTVALEAGGRHLSDLRLWRDGTWLVNAAPQFTTTQARPDRPLMIARIAIQLEPGLYLVTAYGGPSQAWTNTGGADTSGTEKTDDKPFFLRWGIPTLGPALRQQFTMGELGVERFVVPAEPNFFRLELPVASAANIQVGEYLEHDPFDVRGSSASIDKKSLPAVAELNDMGGSGAKLITVTMEAGKSFILQYFNANRVNRINVAGDYWLSSIHAGYAEDSVGASAVLTRQHRNGREEYVAERVVEIAANAPWHRRFNLLDELTLFVKLPEASKISVIGQGVKARYRFEPFLTSRSNDYKTPPWQDSGQVFALDRGLYVLTVQPETKGILDLQLLPPGSMAKNVLSFLNKAVDDAKNLIAPQSSPLEEKLTPVNPVARFAETRLDSDTSYTLYLNQQPGVASGMVLRSLPVDLTYPLPVTQRAGETLTIPVRVSEKGILRALAEDGRSLDIVLDNGKKGTAVDVDAGKYRVTVKNANAVQVYSLMLEPVRLASQTPLPAMPDAKLAGLPKFPVITSGNPDYLDLARNSAKEFKVQVDKPGLYRFESTGLLHTKGMVRTRINPSLFSEIENGVGSNFLIQSYLREGEYQLSVNTQGETQGNLGVQVTRTELLDGGELRAGEVARALLPSGQSLAYRFTIAKRGSYHLQAIGLGRNFKLRIEDADGWPQFAPVVEGEITGVFKAGSYRIIVLPQTADARVLTRLEQVTAQASYKGHGPHRIALGSRIQHVWREPVKKAGSKVKPRTPDQWEFDLPASADLTIALDMEMEATLLNVADLKTPVAQIEANRGWSGKLAAGRYRVQARNSRANNHVSYTLQINATQLLPGLSREVVASAVIPLSVGVDGLVELQSFGQSDVRARLLDAEGALVAQNDDRSDDWNFHIARRLSPGIYTLMVDPVNETQASTTVFMHAPGEVSEKPLALGSNAEINDDKVHIYPLTLKNEHNILLASAQSSDAVGLALEGETAQGWVNLGTTLAKDPSLALPLGPERFKSYRLRAWSADRRSLKVRVRAVAAAVSATSEKLWLQGNLSLSVVDEARDDVRVAMITLPRAGTFRIKGDLTGLQWSDTDLCAEQIGSNAVIAVSGKSLWLISAKQQSVQKSSQNTALAAERQHLPVLDNESLRIELAPGRVGNIDLQLNAQGPSLVLAQARAGQPGISMSARRNPDTIGLVPGEAVTVAMPGATELANVWNASSKNEALELDVRQVPMRRAGSLSLGFGASNGTIASRMVLPIQLVGGQLRVRLTLAAMSAAVFLKRGMVESTHWSGADTLQETVLTDADEMWLLNAESHETHYSLEIAPATGETEQALLPGGLLERNLSTSGRLRVPVEVQKTDANPLHLHVKGNAQALWLENGGRIAAGSDIEIHDSGVLWLQHQPGILVAWLEGRGAQGTKNIGSWFKSLQETTVKPPQTITLRGKTQLFNVKPERATMLHVQTSVPVVTHFMVNGQAPVTDAHLHGANINLFVPAGPSKLVLRAVGADSLSGVVTVLASETADLVKDGPGQEILLAPGSARLFTFEIKQQAPVGIGVKASSDIVHSVLYNERGAVQARGVVQMPTLLPGRYYLAIEAPPDTLPVQVQPVIFGLTKPDTRPPYNILRRYVEGLDNDALLYVPPLPGMADEEDKPARAAKRRRGQNQTGDDENADEEGGENQPSDEESEARMNEEPQ